MSVPRIQHWLRLQALVWTIVLAAIAWRTALGGPLPSGALWVVFALGAVSYGALWRVLGAGRTAADRVTLLRFLGLLAVLASVAVGGIVSWPIWFAALVVVASDLLDGWVARRYGGSEEGAVLDMETDQLTTLGLAVLAAGTVGAGTWVLLLPGFKYLFVLAMTRLGIDAHEPRPIDGDNRRGRIVCALVMSLLLACLFPPLPGPARVACGLVAVVLLASSFSGDAAHLVRKARGASAAR
jgi:phosphatidylglycerophosphate synthase